MQIPVSFTVKAQHLWLSEERALYWEATQTLVLSDLHLGKGGHFRKSGIAVPSKILLHDLQRLIGLVHYFQPKRILITGDLFHSHANEEMALFTKWRQDLATYEILLVQGNHDLLAPSWYDQHSISVVQGNYQEGPFAFTHDPNHVVLSDAYTFTGHIHPGYIFRGKGRQQLKFPCFHFGPQSAILPAFGGFTGSVAVEPKDGDTIFAIVENKLIRVQ